MHKTQRYRASTCAAALVFLVAHSGNAGVPQVSPPTGLVARATTPTHVFVYWDSTLGAESYEIFRSSNGTSFSSVGTSGPNYYNDPTVAAGTSYLYRARAVGATSVSGDSNSDVATTVMFTDATLTAGVTPVKAIHVTQLRTAFNAVRVLAGLSPITFAPLGTTILATHVTELRNALNAARSTLALPPLTYTDPAITAGVTPVRAVHIRELRSGVNGASRGGCDPGTGSCSGNVGTHCSDDGQALLTETCDPDQATACNAQTGRCEGACAPVSLANITTPSIGCDFYPTVTANIVASTFHFAAVVSNATASSATIKVTRGAALITTFTVAAGSVGIINLAWIASLKGPDDGTAFPASVYVAQGAYRLRSTQPVTVYQYSPLQFTVGGMFSYSNDASLLFPAHTWGTQYRVASQYHLEPLSGFYAVTAKDDGTVVTTTSPGGLIKPGSGLPVNGSGTVILNAGDVLEIVTASGTPANDVTGTLISTSKPVQVIGGHQCGNVPLATGLCDHMEESLRLESSLSTSYVVVAPLIPDGTARVRRVRIVATQDSTTLAYDPPQAGLTTSLEAGGWLETLNTAASFKITSSQPVLVAEYMTGSFAAVPNLGDPSMFVATGTDQYRSSHTFFAATNYSFNFVNIVAPAGATVTLDGVALPASDFTAIGTSGFSVARKALSNSGSGQHAITATAPVGISVYGYGQYTSYWY